MLSTAIPNAFSDSDLSLALTSLNLSTSYSPLTYDFTTLTAVRFSCILRLTRSIAFYIFAYNGLTFIIIMISKTASIGSATKNTRASVLLIVNAIDDANISITGLLPKGLIPVDTEFWILVTSLVRRVTSDDTLK